MTNKLFRLLLLTHLFLPFSQLLAEDVGDELLPPEQAFELSAHTSDENTITAHWKIADGYFLYRDKFTFQVKTPGYKLGEFDIPNGKKKHDEFFGDVEIHRNEVSIGIPVIRETDAAQSIEIDAVSQGCADIGVCYPPQTQHIALTLPPETPTAAKPENPLTTLTNLGGTLGDTTDDFLPPDEAFQFTVDTQDANTLIATWRIEDGYYLYRNKIKFALEDPQGATLGEITLPEGKLKHDEFFGDVEIYSKNTEVLIPLILSQGAPSQIKLITEYQGCAEAGICYPPITKTPEITLIKAGPADNSKLSDDSQQASPSTAESTNTETAPEIASSSSPENFQSEQDRIAQTLATGNTWLTVISFFGFGLLLAFTPCVFPMIPILSGIIIGQGKSITSTKAFTLSLVYVLAMAATYTIAGVLVGMSGENVQAWFQNPWVLSIFAAIFVLLALSMFGFYELQMPSSVQSKLSQISNSQQGGSLAGAGIMGFLSALIVGPCVTAPLIGALIYIADTGDAILGGLALFALSMGMGAPLLVIGASAGKLLPKAGPWMDVTKAIFGVLLLGVAIWLLERILPIQATMILIGILLIVSAIYMGALETIKQGVSGWFRLWKGVGLVMLIYGALLIVGAAAGGQSYLQPLKGALVANGPTQTQHGLSFEPVKGVQQLETVLAEAQRQGRPIMLDFYADWCVSCKEMEAFTFTDPAVQTTLADVVLAQVDVTQNDDLDKQLLKHFGLFGPPAILFFTPNGEEQHPYRVVGFMSADDFNTHVKKAISAASSI